MSNDKINKCKQRAKQLKKVRTELTHCQRLDVAARELGFSSYQNLIKGASGDAR